MSFELNKVFMAMNDRKIAFFPIYARILGNNITAGVLLSQICYWYGKMKGEVFYKTDNEWKEETVLGRKELMNAKKKLIEFGFIEIERRGIPAKSYYTVHPDRIMKAIAEFKETEQDDDSFESSCAEREQLDILSCAEREQLAVHRGNNCSAPNGTTTTIDYTIDYTDDDAQKICAPIDHQEKISDSFNQISYMVETWNEMANETGILQVDPNALPSPNFNPVWETLRKDGWDELIKMLKNSPFLGKNNNGRWRATFSWVTDPKHLDEVLNGKYCSRHIRLHEGPKPKDPIHPLPAGFLQSHQWTGQCAVFWDYCVGVWLDMKNFEWKLASDGYTWQKLNQITIK